MNVEWESIDTAPKDGSAVLAWHPDWNVPTFVRWVLNHRTKTEFWNDLIEWDCYSLEHDPPTHWLRLPEPPSKPPAPVHSGTEQSNGENDG
jgi:hypothetical protein